MSKAFLKAILCQLNIWGNSNLYGHLLNTDRRPPRHADLFFKVLKCYGKREAINSKLATRNGFICQYSPMAIRSLALARL
jgi:hypothetical protein